MLIYRANHIADNHSHQARHGSLDAAEIARRFRLRTDAEYRDERRHPGWVVCHRIHPRRRTGGAVALAVDNRDDIRGLQAHLCGSHEHKVRFGLAVLAPAAEIIPSDDCIYGYAGGIKCLLHLGLTMVGNDRRTDTAFTDGIDQLPAQSVHSC